MELIAESGIVDSLEVVEVNPILDRENQTAQAGRRAGRERPRRAHSVTRARTCPRGPPRVPPAISLAAARFTRVKRNCDESGTSRPRRRSARTRPSRRRGRPARRRARGSSPSVAAYSSSWSSRTSPNCSACTSSVGMPAEHRRGRRLAAELAVHGRDGGARVAPAQATVGRRARDARAPPPRAPRAASRRRSSAAPRSPRPRDAKAWSFAASWAKSKPTCGRIWIAGSSSTAHETQLRPARGELQHEPAAEAVADPHRAARRRSKRLEQVVQVRLEVPWRLPLRRPWPRRSGASTWKSRRQPLLRQPADSAVRAPRRRARTRPSERPASPHSWTCSRIRGHTSERCSACSTTSTATSPRSSEVLERGRRRGGRPLAARRRLRHAEPVAARDARPPASSFRTRPGSAATASAGCASRRSTGRR